jgi:release factor glutamine methyltransferase
MDRAASLIALGRALKASGYTFVTVTPETHRRVNGRTSARATGGGGAGRDDSCAPGAARSVVASLRDVFGWSRPFDRAGLPPAILDLLAEAGALLELRDAPGTLRSAVRFSSLGSDLFVHSAYPTSQPDAVFFGPDTYRFAAAIARLGHGSKRCVDVGCGSGAGGIVAGRTGARIVLADINEEALVHARVNAALAGMSAEIVQSDVLSAVEGPFDLVVSNPPYLIDERRRTYRDGGGAFGEALSIRIAREALARLELGGTLLLYTGSAVVEGEDVFLRAVTPILQRAGATFRYEELDPDVFGDELEMAPYATVERIAAVLLTATRPL